MIMEAFISAPCYCNFFRLPHVHVFFSKSLVHKKCQMRADAKMRRRKIDTTIMRIKGTQQHKSPHTGAAPMLQTLRFPTLLFTCQSRGVESP